MLAACDAAARVSLMTVANETLSMVVDLIVSDMVLGLKPPPNVQISIWCLHEVACCRRPAGQACLCNSAIYVDNNTLAVGHDQACD